MIYLNCALKPTVHLKGQKRFSVIIGASSSSRFTLTVIVVMDGTKLPLILIIKRKQKVAVEKRLQSILFQVAIGCVHENSGHTTVQRLSGTRQSINFTLRITMDILLYFRPTPNALKAMNYTLVLYDSARLHWPNRQDISKWLKKILMNFRSKS